MITVVFPLSIQLDYSELRYSLRSVEKHLTPPFEVVIVTDQLPGWINNVTQIELGDIKAQKQPSIKRKILAALEYRDKILFLSDDVYLLHPPDITKYYCYGDLKKIAESGSRPLVKQLEALGKSTTNFNIHGYIYYEKEKFKELPFSNDCIQKSGYCNYHNIQGTEIPDFKILNKLSPEQIYSAIKDRPFFSTANAGFKYALPVLKNLFPNKSQFEFD